MMKKPFNSKGGQLLILPLIMYMIIFVIIIIMFVVIATFAPDDYEEKDVDQRALSTHRELQSVFALHVDNNSLSYWITQGDLQEQQMLQYNATFQELGLCVSILNFGEDLTKKNLLGDVTCYSLSNILFSNYREEMKEKTFFEFGNKTVILFFSEPTKNSELLFGVEGRIQ